MAEANRTTLSKSDEVIPTVVLGLALMEDALMGRTGPSDLDEYAMELQDTWPVEEAIKKLFSADQAANDVALSVLSAHRQNVMEGEDTGVSPDRWRTRLIDAARSAVINHLRKEEEALALLAGRLFAAGYMAAEAQVKAQAMPSGQA